MIESQSMFYDASYGIDEEYQEYEAEADAEHSSITRT